MSDSRVVRWSVCAAACAALWFGMPESAWSQTTVVLSAPNIESFDTIVRGGASQWKNLDRQALATMASDLADDQRHTLLKFDTETTIPSNASIGTATLTLTVKGGGTEARALAAYRIAQSFDATVATWWNRNSSATWWAGGGDLDTFVAQAMAGAAVGSTVSFDVTSLVQQTVKGTYGSRYTRVGVVDPGAASSASYREFYSSEAADPTVRPTLTVVYCAAGTTCVAAPPASSLPTGWQTTDLGSVTPAGTASGTTASLTLEGAGADVWGAADAFRFAYQTLTGDGSIVSRVESLEAVTGWTKAGVMMRESLSPGSRHAFMLVSGWQGFAFQRRLATGGSSTSTGGGSGSAPGWVRLTRTGNVFSAYRSTDGSTWTLVGSDTISMPAMIYVGVAVTSHQNGTLSTAVFADTALVIAPTTAPSDGTSSGTTSPTPTPAPSPAPTSAPLAVLHWNTHHGGIGTDGVYNPDRLANWIVRMNPDIVSLNEIDNESQASGFASLLSTKTATTWRYRYDGRGNAIVTKLAINSSSTCLVNSGADRKAVQVSTTVAGRTINLWSAHLALDSSSVRTAEVNALAACEQSLTEARLAVGDFNMQPYSSEYYAATTTHVDAWLAASAAGTALNYPGNCDGCTRNSRIDYVFYSKGATSLSLDSAQIVDTRDANGVMPSDHKPMLVKFTVR